MASMEKAGRNYYNIQVVNPWKKDFLFVLMDMVANPKTNIDVLVANVLCNTVILMILLGSLLTTIV